MQATPREVSVPAEAFDRLRSVLAQDAGDEAGVNLLHAAGFATGEAFFDLFAHTRAGSIADLSNDDFWSRLGAFFDGRGWGTLSLDSPHPGVSVLSSADWAESDETSRAHPSCAFTSGVLAYLLTRTAGAPVAVLETACRSRGDARCDFAFGSERTIQSLYAVLLEGHSLSQALSRL